MPSVTASSVEALIPFVAGVVGLALSFRKATTPQAERAGKFLRWASPVLIVIAVVLFVTGLASKPDAPPDLEAIANGIKTKMKLPTQVDEATRLDDIRAVSTHELGYFLTLTRMTKADLATNPVAERMESLLRATACKDPDYAKLLEVRVTVRVTYQTLDAAEAARIVIAPKDCGY